MPRRYIRLHRPLLVMLYILCRLFTLYKKIWASHSSCVFARWHHSAMKFLNKKDNDCVQHIILQKFTNFHAIRSWSFQNICKEIGWPRFFNIAEVHQFPCNFVMEFSEYLQWDRMAGGPVFCASLYVYLTLPKSKHRNTQSQHTVRGYRQSRTRYSYTHKKDVDSSSIIVKMPRHK